MPGAAFAQVNCYVMSLGRPSLKAHVSKARPSVRSIGRPSWMTGLALQRHPCVSLRIVSRQGPSIPHFSESLYDDYCSICDDKERWHDF